MVPRAPVLATFAILVFGAPGLAISLADDEIHASLMTSAAALPVADPADSQETPESRTPFSASASLSKSFTLTLTEYTSVRFQLEQVRYALDFRVELPAPCVAPEFPSMIVYADTTATHSAACALQAGSHTITVSSPQGAAAGILHLFGAALPLTEIA